MFIGRHKYNLNKLKIGIGVCSSILGIALINNVQNVNVHADAINWDNQNAETKVVNGNSNANQSTNNVKVSNVQSTKQNYVVKLQTSNVQAGQINKTKIAQFNSNSKIYGLNNSNELSKNNGDGYVITNAGTFNGKPVDIGVTINNVQNAQGTYTTKWSNGDKASQTGKVDNDFSYQDGVIVNSQMVQPIAPSQTRSRTEDQQVSIKVPDYWWHFRYTDGTDGSEADVFYDPVLVTQMSSVWGVDQNDVLHYLVSRYSSDFVIENNWQQYLKNVDFNQASAITPTLSRDNVFHEDSEYEFTENDSSFTGDLTRVHYNSSIAKGYTPKYSENNPYILSALGGVSPNGYYIVRSRYNNNDEALNALLSRKKYEPTWNDVLRGGLVSVNSYPITQCDNEAFANFSNSDKRVIMTKPVNVTDHLQIDQVKNGNLNYDYTVGLYDHDTGDLITSLKPEYKDGIKVGKTATIADTVMNNAIKNKIADIRNNKAAVAFNGTAENDNVSFYQETTPVQDVSKLTATASRTITLHFPNNQKPASYDSIVNNNNQIVQILKFTRTGTIDLVTGQTTYTSWQGDSKFPDVKLPKIPGFKLQIS